MVAESFEAWVIPQGKAAILELHGEVNAFAEERIQGAFSEAEQLEMHAIILDFAAVDYINSAGISLIVQLLLRARQSQRRLLACGLSDHFQEIFRITRLSDYIDIFPNIEQAVQNVQQHTKAQGKNVEHRHTTT